MRIEISKFIYNLVLVFTKNLVILKSLACMVWSLLTFPWDHYECHQPWCFAQRSKWAKSALGVLLTESRLSNLKSSWQMLSDKSPVSVKVLTQPMLTWLIFWQDRCFGPHVQGSGRLVLLLVFTRGLVNLKSLVLMIWSLLTLLWDLYERLQSVTNPDVLVGLEKLLTGHNVLWKS